ncbi:serine hydrolase [Nocardia stercoris]|uniref:Serine hydrolase n=1 Tax=Nocardia stercoris TaxID=2483361 RepID=A0A3M2LH60_9NOCA|nr:serine hydrolase [Nocardia stercoris]RMI35325.1 serine hydrolase [Nocardia stercoris]
METIFRAAGAQGWVHARCLECAAEVGSGADEPVVLASVVKVLLVLEFARQVAAEQLDPTDRVRISAADRLGGVGTAGFFDDAEISLRDAAFMAITVSDNTAADLLFDRVGVANVRSLVTELGLTRTRVLGAPRDTLHTLAQDIGASDPVDFAQRFQTLSPQEYFGTRATDPLRTTASTPRDMTRLLALIDQDRAAPPDACSWVRELMRRQVYTHRLASGFRPGTRIWSKTGSLPGFRNEVGVVEDSDGFRCAVAVFTKVDSLAVRMPMVDRAIGAVARAAVDRLAHSCPKTVLH